MPLQPKLQTEKKSPGHLRRACSCQEESAWHGREQTHSESVSKLNQHWPGHYQLGLLILGPGGRSPVPSLEVLCRCCQGPECSAVEPLPRGGGAGGGGKGATAHPSSILKLCSPRLWHCLKDIFDILCDFSCLLWFLFLSHKKLSQYPLASQLCLSTVKATTQ